MAFRFRVVVATLLPMSTLCPWHPQVAEGLPSPPSVVADPRVTASGGPVTASGNCSGSPHLLVTAQAAGWNDIPPDFVDVTLPTDSYGNWSTTFPMPVLPSTVTVWCTQGSVMESAVTLISPNDGLISLFGQLESDGGVTATIPNVLSPERLAAFTANGGPVPIAILDGNGRVRLQPSGLPGRLVIVGIESLGENAEARQNSRVQGWSIDIGSITVGATATQLVPAQRVCLLMLEGAVCGS